MNFQKKFVGLIFIFISSHALSFDRHCEDYSAISTETNDGRQIKLIIPESKVHKAGSWSPDDGEPRLSLTSAFLKAKEWSNNNLPRYDGIIIDSVAIKKYSCFSRGDKEPYWFYLVNYSPVIDGNELWGSGNWLAILMTGEVIAPVKK